MFSDNSLLPKETIRLAALGILSEGPETYADLATEIRGFVGRIAGPSIELSGSSIELLRYEGLVEPADDSDDPPLCLTDKGRDELVVLLNATVRPPLTDLSKLVIALKMRFFEVLDEAQQRQQADLLIDACELELARLKDLRDAETDGIKGHDPFREWLSHDIELAQARMDWLRGFRDRI